MKEGQRCGSDRRFSCRYPYFKHRYTLDRAHYKITFFEHFSLQVGIMNRFLWTWNQIEASKVCNKLKVTILGKKVRKRVYLAIKIRKEFYTIKPNLCDEAFFLN